MIHNQRSLTSRTGRAAPNFLLGLALILGLAVWLVLHWSDVGSRALTGVSAAAVDQGPAHAEGDAALVDLADGDLPERDLAAVPAIAERQAEEIDQVQNESEDRAPLGSVRVLAGRVVLRSLDPDASSLPTLEQLNGSVRCWARVGSEMTDVILPIAAGRFHLDALVPAGAPVTTVDGAHSLGRSLDAIRFSLETPELTGLRSLLMRDPQTLEVVDWPPEWRAGTLDVELCVTESEVMTLSVVDAVSGVHLNGVKVIRMLESDWLEYPDEEVSKGVGSASLTTDTSSPVELAAHPSDMERASAACLVGAAGHAWKSVTLDLIEGGERTVELVPGGSLELSWYGDAPSGMELLLLRGGEDFPVHAKKVQSTGAWSYSGLAPGPYDVRIVLGDWGQKHLVLAQRTLHVRAGMVSKATLEIEDPGAPEYAQVAGTLIVPVAWGLPREEIKLEVTQLSTSLTGSQLRESIPPDRFIDDSSNEGHFRFDFGAMEMGTYRAVLESLPFDFEFEVGRDALPGLVLEVPPPVNVIVRVVDAVTRKRIETLSSISCRARSRGEGRLGQHARTHWDPSLRGFRARVPAMTVLASAGSQGYRGRVDFLAAEGKEVTLEVNSVPKAIIELWHGDVRIPIPSFFDYQVAPLAGDGYDCWSMGDEAVIHVGVTEPGEYRVTLPQLDGFTVPPDVVVDFQPGGTQKVKVPIYAK